MERVGRRWFDSILEYSLGPVTKWFCAILTHVAHWIEHPLCIVPAPIMFVALFPRLDFTLLVWEFDWTKTRLVWPICTRRYLATSVLCVIVTHAAPSRCIWRRRRRRQEARVCGREGKAGRTFVRKVGGRPHTGGSALTRD